MLLPFLLIFFFQYVLPVTTICETQYIELDKGSMYAISQVDFPASLVCSFEFTYPTDSLLQVNIIIEEFRNGRLNLTDAFGGSVERTAPIPPSSELTLYFPPPFFVFTLNTTGESTFYSTIFQTASFKAIKSRAFNKTDTFSITPSSMPLLINVGTIPNGKTYLFKGTPKLSALALRQNSTITTKSIMVYNGSQGDSLFGTMYGLSGWQEFSNLGLYNIAYKRDTDVTDLLFIMDTSDLNTYQSPQILRCDTSMFEAQIVEMNATGKKTFANFLQYQQEKNENICQYSISKFDFSEDTLFEIYDGLPQKTMSKKNFIRSYSAPDMEEGLTLLLTGSKTIVLLNGTMSFLFIQNSSVFDDNAKNVFIVNEKNKLVWSVQNTQLNTLEYNFTCFGNGCSNAQLEVATASLSINTKFRENPKTFTSARDIAVTLYGKAVIECVVRTVDWATVPASDHVATRSPPSDNGISCVQFRFFDCIYLW